MAKRYLGAGVSFEQQDVYQEFSEDGGGGGGSTTLSGLTDVDISNPSDGQTLVFNATSGKWENGAGGGTAGILKVHDSGENDGSTLDHTWAEITSAPFVILESVVEIGEGQEIHSNEMYLARYGYAPPEPGTEPIYSAIFCQWSSTDPTIYTATGPDAYPILHQ